MTIKTRRERPEDQILVDNYHTCEFGEKEHWASYWTQDEQPDGEKQGRVIWHCQHHRDEAREAAA